MEPTKKPSRKRAVPRKRAVFGVKAGRNGTHLYVSANRAEQFRIDSEQYDPVIKFPEAITAWAWWKHERDYPDHTAVYVDGSCLSNGRPGAKAGSGVVIPFRGLFSYPLPGERQTNNRGEIYACIQALLKVPADPVVIYSDSEYTLNTLHSFLPKWRAENPNQLHSQKNIDLFLELERLVQQHPAEVKLLHVSSKANLGNKLADQMAKKGAQGETVSREWN